ncbi:hypothetical protein ABZ234_03625 [Nocardiopsis sp. NPDC006198]|uniref:hypothetical protein n=1 Tax=Nocardiopsis sp. NPDC006198 TaxID=3154472 RepID=UPI0033A0D13F
MNPIDEAAREISVQATTLDVAAARQFLDANATEGRVAAMRTSGAGHLIRKYKINRNLSAIARRIVADHT